MILTRYVKCAASQMATACEPDGALILRESRRSTRYAAEPMIANPTEGGYPKPIPIEIARPRFGIPAKVIIDENNHRKKASYLQVDPLDPHVGDEMDQETEEILWWLGVPITYHAHVPGGGGKQMSRTVPGR